MSSKSYNRRRTHIHKCLNVSVILYTGIVNDIALHSALLKDFIDVVVDVNEKYSRNSINCPL